MKERIMCIKLNYAHIYQSIKLSEIDTLFAEICVGAFIIVNINHIMCSLYI